VTGAELRVWGIRRTRALELVLRSGGGKSALESEDALSASAGTDIESCHGKEAGRLPTAVGAAEPVCRRIWCPVARVRVPDDFVREGDSPCAERSANILHRHQILPVVVLGWNGDSCLWTVLVRGSVAVSPAGTCIRSAAGLPAEAHALAAGNMRRLVNMCWKQTAADAKSSSGMTVIITLAAGVLLQVPPAVWGPPSKRTTGPDSWGRKSRRQTWLGLQFSQGPTETKKRNK
jgi:hypothetical protein